jgi:glycosyltransferase involved in cell wall biosynthesis
MKICLITFEYPPKILGGLGVYAEQLVKGLSAKNIDVTTISRGDRTEFDEKVFRITIPNIQYWRRLFFIKRARSLFAHLNRNWKFDVVHLNGAYPIIQSFGVPTVCTFHSVNFPQIQASLQAISGMKSKEEISNLVFKNTVGCFSDIESVRLSDKIICPSPITAMELQRWCFAGAERIRIIPNGINLKAFDSVKASDVAMLNRYGVEPDNYFLFLGRLVFLKGVDFVIRAFKFVREIRKDLKLAIVGEGPFEPYLRKIADGIPGVVFTGYVGDPSARKLLYDNCLALLVPSFHEVLPTVIMEAMACSKPIIATNVGGNPFMIKHGKNGFLVEASDSEGIANFMNLLCEDYSLRKNLGKFGRDLMEKKFVIERTVGETAKVYESLL